MQYTYITINILALVCVYMYTKHCKTYVEASQYIYICTYVRIHNCH